MTIDESRQNGKTSQIDDISFIRVTTYGFDAFDTVAINNMDILSMGSRPVPSKSIPLVRTNTLLPPYRVCWPYRFLIQFILCLLSQHIKK